MKVPSEGDGRCFSFSLVGTAAPWEQDVSPVQSGTWGWSRALGWTLAPRRAQLHSLLRQGRGEGRGAAWRGGGPTPLCLSQFPGEQRGAGRLVTADARSRACALLCPGFEFPHQFLGPDGTCLGGAEEVTVQSSGSAPGCLCSRSYAEAPASLCVGARGSQQVFLSPER